MEGWLHKIEEKERSCIILDKMEETRSVEHVELNGRKTDTRLPITSITVYAAESLSLQVCVID
jgi:hypothetical protein